MLFQAFIAVVGGALLTLALTPGLDLFGVTCDSAFSRYVLKNTFRNNLFVLAEESPQPDLRRLGRFAADVVDYHTVWRDQPEGLHPDVAAIYPAFIALLNSENFSVRSLAPTNGADKPHRCHAVLDVTLPVPAALQTYHYRSERVRALTERTIIRGEGLLDFEIQPILAGLIGYRYAYLSKFRKDRRIPAGPLHYMQLIRDMDDLPLPDKRSS